MREPLPQGGCGDECCPECYPGCPTYVCPTSQEVECLEHGGFDNCCDHPRCPGNFDRPRPCMYCGKDPAEGYASITTPENGEQWFCHGDDDDTSCYERAQWEASRG